MQYFVNNTVVAMLHFTFDHMLSKQAGNAPTACLLMLTLCQRCCLCCADC
jgi:hypothetical protein